MSNTATDTPPTFTCDDPTCDAAFPCPACIDRWHLANNRTPVFTTGAINLGSRNRDRSTPRRNGNGTGCGTSRRSTREARWTKADGQWCVRTETGKTGETVTVHRNNGDTSEVTLGAEVLPDTFLPAQDEAEAAEARWTNHNGEWLVRVDGAPGDVVTVTNRAGKSTDVVLTTEATDGVWNHTRPAAPVVTEGLDLNPLFDGLFTQAGDARTSVLVAVPGGDTRLKLRIDRPRDGRHAGRIFVKDAAVYGGGQRYGVQNVGERYSGKVTEALEAILADRDGALAAYGQLTSHCGICGKALEDAESVSAGLGPWCRSQL